ncbi:sensor histidine kinase [Lacrimispora sp.]|uniref:sensor histidine kinase n=1 Tax=Lacrimispora sp. TaxID=2719234 RepID=UPI00289C9465|nr:HAMP domain-containing sensor histidine kinase [Lacrimispora sp.]
MNKRKKHRLIPLYLLFFFAAFALCFAMGFGLSSLVFRLMGEPSKLIASVVTGLFGLAIFIAIISLLRLLAEIYGKKHPEWKKRFEHNRAIKDTLDAMNRISRGDFNVFILVEDHDPMSEIAASVNKMAKELSSMEQVRQDFISNVSHEIQSPLTSISGFAALLRNGGLSEDMCLHYINIIETESKRLSKLSENLLKLSALEAEKIDYHEYRLDKQIENAILMLEPQWAMKNINLEADLPGIVVGGDEELLSQVWVNLIHNAIKFTPMDGEIKVTLSTDSDTVFVAVSDNGAGIAAEDRIHVFERFYKVDKARDRSLGGNGLGLSIVKKIAELHGGTASVDSEIGKGTAFTVRLPLPKK